MSQTDPFHCHYIYCTYSKVHVKTCLRQNNPIFTGRFLSFLTATGAVKNMITMLDVLSSYFRKKIYFLIDVVSREVKRPEDNFLYTQMFNFHVNKLSCHTGWAREVLVRMYKYIKYEALQICKYTMYSIHSKE